MGTVNLRNCRVSLNGQLIGTAVDISYVPQKPTKLYRLKDTATGLYYRHRYSQYRGGDWVEADKATIWTKPGGVAGALGAVREKWKHNYANFVIETATIDPLLLEWK